MDCASMATTTRGSSHFTGKLPQPNSLHGSSSFLQMKQTHFSVQAIGLKPLHISSKMELDHHKHGGFCKPIESFRGRPLIACCALAERPTNVSNYCVSEDLPYCELQRLVSEFEGLVEPVERVKRLLHYASFLPHLNDSDKIKNNRVMGCTAQVWLKAEMEEGGKMRFFADSDSEITRGFCACLIHVLDGAFPDEVLRLKTEDLASLNVGLAGRAHSRVNTWHNVLLSMQKKTRALVAERDGRPFVEPFPSLVVASDEIHPQGSYAEAQAKFLSPDDLKVQELVEVLTEKKIGIVAHFYMDPEVQGVLTAAAQQWPHIRISDSLVMADTAVKMAKDGCKFITVLGVDFMSENVRAILDQSGFEKVGVYRMSSEQIGCSLAEAAENPAYTNFLEGASRSPPSLHVIYINTSLNTKAKSHELVPTITCTSSNVVQTVLQAFAQIPNLNIWYGPDSYMGANLAELFQQMSNMSNEEIFEIHPLHNRSSIRSLLPHLHYYQDGTCIVHDLFGSEVVARIRDGYSDAFLTAHFEVPGEMFSLAMEAKKRGMGVVGSTQNILDFITQRVKEAIERNTDESLQFVLGTESGMITAIVAAIRKLLISGKARPGSAYINVEIVFPVSSNAVTKTVTSFGGLSSIDSSDLVKLSVVPGVQAGEGCSIHGGCASCPYMKMNSLSSLLRICHQLPDTENSLSTYKASRFEERTLHGRSVADLGCEPILHMRHFQATGKLSDKLVDQILLKSSSTRI
ncbi:hypothetical protein AMTRI_Chr06g176340 [Amborella trichopoda]|uniref:Quinolinate synthase, chloroplastic n=1 Tax=Amborella trichopoda TaxID=13333 RepID=U5D2A3_AMBTC|nr:quinolinate synthase, chloroplastic [Amborella trichopoda]XP_020528222.1 quinolinate synthase, chloroplastic [Amborella trichopoda]XP_020528223.1 quinolinate synthase, chloroplastic [Amborella trichopoda]ERN14493.1 hypothetical protein AMTR_s00174p00061480 [Amborella trichopoda]|eukprot:XP_006853026.1 quinolinate synthase, chloroplastic [Amborella trichopoda]